MKVELKRGEKLKVAKKMGVSNPTLQKLLSEPRFLLGRSTIPFMDVKKTDKLTFVIGEFKYKLTREKL